MKDSGIIILGSKGQLGSALCKKYPLARAVDAEELDITSVKALEKYDWEGIKFILNAAAYTNVDVAETAEGRVAAWMINADAVVNLIAICSQHDIVFVHISTDYVFDGTNDNHKEDEPFSPLNVYGASKAAGDLVVSLLPKFYILRTSWVIGEGKNFVRTMIEMGRKGVSPTVVADQIGRLTFTKELVRAIDYLIQKQLAFGTYNVTNCGESVSWADIAREIFKLAHFDLKVTDISTLEYFAGKDWVAPRPFKSTLDLSKIESSGFQSTDWRDGLQEYIIKELQ